MGRPEATRAPQRWMQELGDVGGESQKLLHEYEVMGDEDNNEALGRRDLVVAGVGVGLSGLLTDGGADHQTHAKKICKNTPLTIH